MKSYCIEVPVCGKAIFYVEAKNKKEAIKKIIEQDIEPDEKEIDYFYEEPIVEGNVFYGAINETEISEME